MKPPALSVLPIVDRELRVAARRPATQWLRAAAALALTLVWLGLMLAHQPGGQQAQLGHNLIRALSLLAFGCALVAGVFLTADCLSAERREGTLGLLFLTDLTALDVALGKLAATSLHACYALLVLIWLLATLLAFNLPRGEACFIIAFVAAYVLHLYWKCALAIEATRRFSEDRASGALELLLSTPLSPAIILAGQRRELSRGFALRFTVVCAVSIGLLLLANKVMDHGVNHFFTVVFIGGLILFPVDDYALAWAGMLAGLRGTRHHRATLVTLARVMLPGWVGIFVFVVLGFSGLLIGPDPLMPMAVIWIGFNWVWNVVLVSRTKRQLAAGFRALAAGEKSRASGISES